MNLKSTIVQRTAGFLKVALLLGLFFSQINSAHANWKSFPLVANFSQSQQTNNTNLGVIAYHPEVEEKVLNLFGREKFRIQGEYPSLKSLAESILTMAAQPFEKRAAQYQDLKKKLNDHGFNVILAPRHVIGSDSFETYVHKAIEAYGLEQGRTVVWMANTYSNQLPPYSKFSISNLRRSALAIPLATSALIVADVSLFGHFGLRDLLLGIAGTIGSGISVNFSVPKNNKILAVNSNNPSAHALDLKTLNKNGTVGILVKNTLSGKIPERAKIPTKQQIQYFLQNSTRSGTIYLNNEDASSSLPKDLGLPSFSEVLEATGVFEARVVEEWSVSTTQHGELFVRLQSEAPYSTKALVAPPFMNSAGIRLSPLGPGESRMILIKQKNETTSAATVLELLSHAKK